MRGDCIIDKIYFYFISSMYPIGPGVHAFQFQVHFTDLFWFCFKLNAFQRLYFVRPQSG